MWPRKKKFIFFFHGESALRAPATQFQFRDSNGHSGACRKDGVLLKSIQNFNLIKCNAIHIPRSVDMIEHAIWLVKFCIDLNEKRSEQNKKVLPLNSAVVCSRSFSLENTRPSIAYLPSRFFHKKSLARKNKKNLFFLFYKNKIYFIFIIKIIYYFYLLLSKLKFSTQKHRFRVNGHKREIPFFRNREDYCVLPWNKRFHNLVLY
jgi:hypothetical protein